MNEVIYSNRILWEPCGRYTHHRIPGMLVTNKGTLLAYCEARTNLNDWALMDVILQRSEDHGQNFGEPIILANGDVKHKTVNNPVMMQDKNGRIHFLYCEDYGINGGKIYRRYSDDDGVTWSDKVDITYATLPDYRNAFAIGPGHGICTSSGMLVVPIWLVPKRYGAKLTAHMPSEVSTLYSIDNGETWEIGELLGNSDEVISPNETAVAETSDGGVYLSIRHLSMQRAVAYSKNGYANWYDYHADYKLDDPQCFGAVVSYCDEKHPHTLLFANCDTKEARRNVTVRLSTDDGKTWSKGKVIDAIEGGYVEMIADGKNGLIYVLYEKKGGLTDHLVSFNYEWLL